MRKYYWMIFVVVVFMFGACATKTQRAITAQKHFEVVAAEENRGPDPTGKIFGYDVELAVPIIKYQYEAENLKNPTWQLYAALYWSDGDRWIPINHGDYKDYIVATEKKDDQLFGRLTLPKIKNGTGHYALIIWGDETTGKWLWINQYSKATFPDKNGNPHYVLVADTNKQVVVIPPRDISRFD